MDQKCSVLEEQINEDKFNLLRFVHRRCVVYNILDIKKSGVVTTYRITKHRRRHDTENNIELLYTVQCEYCGRRRHSNSAGQSEPVGLLHQPLRLYHPQLMDNVGLLHQPLRLYHPQLMENVGLAFLTLFGGGCSV